jgi:ethanolamine ammonia-lyase small subunit
MDDLTRWTVTVSTETDTALRSWLADHGDASDAGLARFVEDAVSTELLRRVIRKTQERNAHVPPEVLQAEIDQACAEARQEFWKDRKWWDD